MVVTIVMLVALVASVLAVHVVEFRPWRPSIEEMHRRLQTDAMKAWEEEFGPKPVPLYQTLDRYEQLISEAEARQRSMERQTREIRSGIETLQSNPFNPRTRDYWQHRAHQANPELTFQDYLTNSGFPTFMDQGAYQMMSNPTAPGGPPMNQGIPGIPSQNYMTHYPAWVEPLNPPPGRPDQSR